MERMLYVAWGNCFSVTCLGSLLTGGINKCNKIFWFFFIKSAYFVSMNNAILRNHIYDSADYFTCA